MCLYHYFLANESISLVLAQTEEEPRNSVARKLLELIDSKDDNFIAPILRKFNPTKSVDDHGSIVDYCNDQSFESPIFSNKTKIEIIELLNKVIRNEDPLEYLRSFKTNTRHTERAIRLLVQPETRGKNYGNRLDWARSCYEARQSNIKWHQNDSD